ncbi:mercury methylation ferredoxin HgcB [Desulfopila inferna]|uniref:mercury methylation ferredoxin HgcB n=1 Tax=Desulfopila inferna TaxID=468528 RepID=UPI0019636AAC|nr:mercury methylation ferredoxin HgcB [Desulfopila inferna]MBM9603263.1 4Fe-4S dicluster domain-containing protein [Desulfopila inferna]
MKGLRYIENVASLTLDKDRCVGCSTCVTVCPHRVFQLQESKAVMVDKNGCMECGACAVNCPVDAIRVDPGVGCASLIINRWLKGKNLPSGSCC